MKAAVIVFPGSNCDRDVAVALTQSMKKPPVMVWHKDTSLPPVDLIVLPGGFSYGDYLRSGAMAARSPIMQEVVAAASKGKYVLGICNGFQVLTEAQLLPGTLMRNKHLKFLCKNVHLKVCTVKTPYTATYNNDQVVTMPIAHHDGCYVADEATIAEMEAQNQIVFRYSDATGNINENANPNGSVTNIAGIVNKERNVLGMMPHPERSVDPVLGGTDGKYLFDCIVNALP